MKYRCETGEERSSVATIATMVRPAVTRRYDDRFFVGMSVAILGTVVLGFGPTYFYRGTVFAKLPSVLVHVHGAVFSSWVILYVVQNILVATKKIKWHRTLGTFGGFLVAAMVVLGWAATIATVRRGATPSIFTPAEFLVINCWGIVLFAAMVAWAIVKRRDGPAHKRLMLLATIGIMPPAITRFVIFGLHKSGGLIPLYMLALCGAVFVFDVCTRRRPHYATVVGTLVTFSVPATATALKTMPALQHAASWLIAHP